MEDCACVSSSTCEEVNCPVPGTVLLSWITSAPNLDLILQSRHLCSVLLSVLQLCHLSERYLLTAALGGVIKLKHIGEGRKLERYEPVNCSEMPGFLKESQAE